jgi:hypothetical protein
MRQGTLKFCKSSAVCVSPKLSCVGIERQMDCVTLEYALVISSVCTNVDSSSFLCLAAGERR